MRVNIGTSQIKNSDYERLLGINIEYKLIFENHINQICNKARAKIKALAKIASFLNKKKRKLLMNAFFKSQFSYCPLSLMFHSRTLKNKINRLHERYLRIIYRDSTSSFTDLLEIDNSVSVHHRNIQSASSHCLTWHRITLPLGTEIWELVPSDMKNLSSLTAFKKVIKQWKPHACLCRTYIYQVGFV